MSLSFEYSGLNSVGKSLVLATLLFISILAPSAGVVTAEEEFSAGIDLPDEAKAGEAVSISAPITVPDLLGDHETELTLTLYVDGEKESTKTITIRDGKSTTVSFEHTFEKEGKHAVKAEVETSLAGQTFSDSVSTTIRINAPSTSVESSAPSIDETSVTGAVFSTPASLQDEIAAYRDRSSLDLAPYAFILATEDELYLVFTDEQPQKGIATVKGASSKQKISAQGFSFNILAATSSSFDTKGSQATVNEIASNPDAYQLELVRVQATHQRVSSVTDPDQGSDPTVAISSGVLVENQQTESDVLSQPGQKARSLSVNTSTDKLGASGQSEIGSLLDTKRSHLYTFGFEKSFWTDTESTVDGIVLTPGSQAMEFATTFDQAGIVRSGTGEPLLYVVNSEFNSKQYDSITAVQNQADDGALVSVSANLYGKTLSTQETLEHTTSCGKSIAQIPAPNGAVCVDVVQDTLIHSGVAWTSTPQSQNDVLLVAGLSSRELDKPSKRITGEYRIVGEVVSTSRFDESLPDGRILIVYDLERVGDTDYSAVSHHGQELIDSQFGDLQAAVQTQITGNSNLASGSNQEDSRQNADENSQSSNKESKQQNQETDDDSFLGVDSPDWVGGDDGFFSGITEGIADLFGSDDK